MSGFDRRQGIGASEAGAVLGYSPFATATDVWLSKMSEEKVVLGTDDMTPAQEWGHRLEDAILRKYEDVTGSIAVGTNTKKHSQGHFGDIYPVFATPDGLIAGGGLVDAKCTNHEDGWGEQGTDEIPNHYLLQGVIQMAVCEQPWVDFAVLFLARRRFGIWRVQRDEALELLVLRRLASWWEDYVVTRTPPDATTPKYLATLRSTGSWVEDPDRVLVSMFKEADQERKAAQKKYDELKEMVQRTIGDNDGIKAEGLGKVSWRTNKRGTRTFRATWEE